MYFLLLAFYVFFCFFFFAILLKSFKVPKQRGKEEEIQDRSKGSKNLETWWQKCPWIWRGKLWSGQICHVSGNF